jgi:transposase
VPVVASTRIDEEGFVTVIIGIDPHKATHIAVAVDNDEQSVAQFEVRAQRNQTERLLAWAAPFRDRLWAIESADGLGTRRGRTPAFDR